MKRPISLTSPLGITGILAIIVALALLTGCGTLSGPPKAWEQKYYDITTNTIEMVNWYTNEVTITNYQDVIVQTEVPGTTNVVNITNVIPVLHYQTNLVAITNVIDESYIFKPNERAKDEIVGTATTIGGYAGPAVGQTAGLISTIGLALWGVLRSRKKGKTAANLAMEIQVAREIMKTTAPQAEKAYKDFLVKHQLKADTFKDVVGILKSNTTNEDAKRLADEVIKATT